MTVICYSKRRDFELGREPELPRWALSVITSVLIRRKQRETWPQREGDVMTEAVIGLMHSEDGRRGQRPGDSDGH